MAHYFFLNFFPSLTKYLIFFYVFYVQSMYRIYIKQYMSYVNLCPVLSCFIIFIFNSFVISYWMYFVIIAKKKLEDLFFTRYYFSLVMQVTCWKYCLFKVDKVSCNFMFLQYNLFVSWSQKFETFSNSMYHVETVLNFWKRWNQFITLVQHDSTQQYANG